MPEAAIVATTRFAPQAGVPTRRPPSPRATRARATTVPPSLDIMSDEKARDLGLNLLAPIVTTAVTGLSPAIMGLDPVEAVPAALRNASMGLDTIDLFEINEALAVRLHGSAEALGIPLNKLNIIRGAIAVGQPLGMTCARITATLINLLQWHDKQFGESMCVGGGQGHGHGYRADELRGDLMSERFGGKTAIITGASRGIGLGIAERLVTDGARVVITARTKDALDEAVDHLGGPEHAWGIAGKVDDTEHQGDVIRQTIRNFGSIDFLVNNTGINPAYGPLVDLDLGAARKIVEVNCIAAVSWIQQVHRAWMKEHGGAIVNVSSLSAVRTAPGIGFYGASKAMLNSLTELLAVELGPEIRVNGVAPAVVRTRFAKALYEGREEESGRAYPLKRLGEPKDIGSVVATLLSEDAAWITGQTVLVDGGLSLTSAK
jgi:NAD(P)-dependent dehydrogenase (short-subunit alcohol dehydrogenase family)